MNVFLRALEPEDVDVLYAAENDVAHWKYSDRNQPYSKATLRNYIAHAHEDIYTAGQLRFVLAASEHPFIGMVDLYNFSAMNHRAGVGLLIRKHYRKQGFGVQAIALLEAYVKAHLQLHQLYACFSEDNLPSKKLFEKMGFQKAGVKKDWIFHSGGYHHVLFYQKIL